MVALSPGSTFHGRYEVVRCIKAGGMGAIYEVIHLETRRRRALKLMLPSVLANIDLRARFKLEATIAADIESEHIVETFDAGVDEETGAPFLVMELLRGEDLAAAVERRGKLPPAEVVRLLSQAASALDRTHAAGVIHRDLKPDNLFVTRRDDGSPKLKILDFGIAKVVSESGQPAVKTTVLGTPLYMSAEQVRGDGNVGPRADLYALAHIAFTLLVGKAYWAEEHGALPLYELMTKIIGGCQVPAPERAAQYGGATTPAFGAWFRKATHVLPEERFAHAAEMVEALAEALGEPVPRASAAELDIGRRRGGDASEPTTSPGLETQPGASEVETAVLTGPALPSASVRTESLRTETAAPAALPAPESPRKSPASKRIARVAAAAVAVIAGAALTFRPSGPSKPAALPGAGEGAVSGGAAMLLPSVSASAPAPAITPSTRPTAVPTSASTAPVSSAGSATKAAAPRQVGPAAARPAAKPPVAAPTSQIDTRPKRSLD